MEQPVTVTGRACWIRLAPSPAAQVVGQFVVLPEPGPDEILSACRICRRWRGSLARLLRARWPWQSSVPRRLSRAPCRRGRVAARCPRPSPLPRRCRAPPRSRHPIRVGSVTIPPCKVSRLAWCTRINVPLDYRDPAAGPHQAGLPVVPGDQRHGRRDRSSPSRAAPASRPPTTPRTTAAPSCRCSARRNLLLVNLRGTGNSSAFLCKAVQDWKAADGIAAYTARHRQVRPAAEPHPQAAGRRLRAGQRPLHHGERGQGRGAAAAPAADRQGRFLRRLLRHLLRAGAHRAVREVAPLGDPGRGVSSQRGQSVLPAYDPHRAESIQYLLQPQRGLPPRRAGPLVGADRRAGQVPAPPPGDRPDEDAVRPPGDRARRRDPS